MPQLVVLDTVTISDRPFNFYAVILSPTANFLLESTIERLHYKLEYADRDIGKLAPHAPKEKAYGKVYY